MMGPDFTAAEAEFLLKAVEHVALGAPQRPRRLHADIGVLVAKLIELKKQATAMHAARCRYLEVLNAEDAAHAEQS